jgi:pimeloyl-ACP methyl ester carboxylesterase
VRAAHDNVADPGHNGSDSKAQRMSSLPPVKPLYLDADGVGSVFGLLQMPPDGVRSEIAVFICPPFGWDDVCSYRSRRDWAMDLAASGHPTLRIDLPGSGDSGGSPDDPGLLSAWTDAVGSATDWLTTTTGCQETAAIGIGLGGLVICRAVAEGAAIDDLVLWAVPSRGRAFVRELRAFGRMEAAKFGLPPDDGPRSLPAGSTQAGGFVLSAETTRALEELDVAALAFPTNYVRRALLLERDGIGVDERLRHCLQETGATVKVSPANGYGAMMAGPQEARAPREVFASVESWLGDASLDSDERLAAPPARDRLGPARPSRRAVEDRDTAALTVDGVRIRETPLTIEQPFGQMFGVLAEPVDAAALDLTAVLLNAGAIRRIGPNRMWVDIARRWAARGVPTLRVDLEGLGDADGDGERFTELAELYAPGLVNQVIAVLDALETRGSVRRFLLAGLCSGACWSFHGALQDERVTAAFMLNPRALFWDPLLEATRDFRRGVLRTSSWRRVLSGEVPPGRIIALASRAPLALPRRAVARWSAHRADDDELDRAFDRLRETGKRLQFIFSSNEPLYEELELDGRLERLARRWPNIGFDFIPGRDHTLRPFQSQRSANEALDRALEQELQRTTDQAGRV